MKYLKLGAAVATVALLGAGVAHASGAFSGGHDEAGYDAAEAKVERLEEKFANGGTAAAVAARPKGRRGARGARGPRGPQGPVGPTGAPGPKGTFGSVASVDGPSVFLCSFEAGSCAVGSATANCPPGTTLTGGGYKGAGIVTTVTWSAPVGNGWGVIAVNLDEVPVTALRPVAECASS